MVNERQYTPYRYRRHGRNLARIRKVVVAVAVVGVSLLLVTVLTDDDWPLRPADDIHESVEGETGQVGIGAAEPAGPQEISPVDTGNEQHVADSAAELKIHMLDLINTERSALGLGLVELGTNTAAQSHADSMLDSCTFGHWGVDGLKPYMRYSLAGGYQYNAENVYGLAYCIKAWENYVTVRPKAEISESMKILMSSPGHRDNILDPHHALVNIGLAWDNYNMMVVQHFEYNYASFYKKPSIDDGILSLSLTTKNGATLSDDSTILIQYDPPLRELTRGQIASTYCYDYGLSAATVLAPPPPGSYYTDDFYQEHSSSKCPDPYHVPPNTPAPESVDDALESHRQAMDNSEKAGNTPARMVPFLVADRWDSSPNHLNVSSDISRILAEHGPGVYTITVWGFVRGDTPISEYSVFYGIRPPDGYS